MANALYDSGREGFLDGSINWASDTIKVTLSKGYSVNLATHKFLTDFLGAGGLQVATQTITSKGVAAGVASGANSVFSAVTAGSACPYLIIYKDTGVSSTSRLIAYYDTAAGLPITPNGGDITVSWDAGPNRIFRL